MIDILKASQGNRRPKIRRSEETCSIYRLKFHLDMDVRWELSGTLHLSPAQHLGDWLPRSPKSTCYRRYHFVLTSGTSPLNGNSRGETSS